MNYIKDSFGYLMPSMLTYLVYSIIFEVSLLLRKETVSWLYRFMLLLLGIYLTVIFSVTVSPMYGYAFDLKHQSVNLIPFQVLKTVPENPLNFIGNIVMFIPIGFVSVFLSHKFQKIYPAMFLGLGISLLIEILQLFLGRSSDVDDLILNTAGSVIGCILGISLLSTFPRIKDLIGIRKKNSQKLRKNDSSKLVFLILCMLVSVFITGAVKRVFYMNAAVNPNIEKTAYDTLQKEHATKNGMHKDKLPSIQATIAASNAFLLNLDHNQELFEKNCNSHIAPASTTKMLTALTLLDICSLTEEVTIGKEITFISPESSTAGLLQGNVLTIKQLLDGLLLPSGNDAAYSIAAYAGKIISDKKGISNEKAIKLFVKKMNEKAIKLGAQHSNFIKPDGFDTEGQYTTARDLAVIATAFMKSDVLKDIVLNTSIRDVFLDGTDVTFKNTNELINPCSDYYYKNAIGLKTGSSDQAGKCLISAAKINNEIYICVIMGSTPEGRWMDSITLFNKISSIK